VTALEGFAIGFAIGLAPYALASAGYALLLAGVALARRVRRRRGRA
jgi:uncharacterized membrane protein YhiD involved in acid resistance